MPREQTSFEGFAESELLEVEGREEHPVRLARRQHAREWHHAVEELKRGNP